MPKELSGLYLEGVKESVVSFIQSRPSASRPFVIAAALECLREHTPMNEVEILGRCRRIRYAARAVR